MNPTSLQKHYSRILKGNCFILFILFLGLMTTVSFAQPTQRYVSNQVVPFSKNVSKTSPNTGVNISTNSVNVQRINPVNGYDLDKLEQLKQKYHRVYKEEQLKAEAFARANNIPVRYNLPDGGVASIRKLGPDGSPIYYRTFNDDAAISTRTNFLYLGGGLGLDLGGDDLTAHVWDGGHARVTHQEYDGAGGANRVSIMDAVSEGGLDLNFHAAHVTGTICASGVIASAKGMAWKTDVRNYRWSSDVSEAIGESMDVSINDGYSMLVSNHSYGYGASGIPDAWFGQYGGDAVAWDNVMYNAPYYLMVVAAGNDGNDSTSNADPLEGNTDFDKLSGHATAKNNLVVANGLDANINPDGTLNSVARSTSSSEGPTDDYRIKPDIMGNGTGLYSTFESSDTAYNSISGTSMASPNVAGTLLLLQEQYRNIHGNFMKAATLKGLALHTADDGGGISGPDAEFGWGLLNAKKASETITDGSLLTGNAIVEELTLNPGQTYQITVESDGINPLMASISWTDPAGNLVTTSNNTTPSLVNDLDVRLDNGTTYFPWRLTGVNSNSNGGDNDVDPFERIDISGASGTYTLTVTHDGPLQNNLAQDYTLIVTGVVKVTDPVISFGETFNSHQEGTDCSYVDLTIPVNIALPASQNVDVSFTVNGSSSASEDGDFILFTPSLQFPAGTTASQDFVVRIFNDSYVEGQEEIYIDMTINANGGDAIIDPNADALYVIINDDDVTPNASYEQEIFYEDFTVPSAEWAEMDADNDNNTWFIWDASASPYFDGMIARSNSWNGVPLDPDNYLISPSISLPSDATSLSVSYVVGSSTDPLFFREHYSFYFTDDVSTAGDIQGGVVLEDNRQLPAVGSEVRSHDINALAGQTGYFVIRHWDCPDEWYLGFDNLLIEATRETQVQTAVNTSGPDQIQLKGSGIGYSNDPTSDKIMMKFSNNDGFDYGCSEVSVSRAGTGAQSYNGSGSPFYVANKTFTVTPSNSTNNADATLTFYFEEAEIAGWEAATGLNRNDLIIGRGSPSFIVETSNVVIGAFGDHVTLTGDFVGIDGTFYFGPQEAFNPCSGVAKVWNGTSWSPSGAPNINSAAVINGNYNTAINGHIDACTLNVNNGVNLTVSADNYIKVNGNIIVDGSLIVEHQANLVQVSDDAAVINNGTIEVHTTSPNLESRDFMVLGSPMTDDTREDVWGSAFLVLYHDTNNFLPNPDVALLQPGAENFADDNYDNWIQYPSGPINPGEGYIVRPQTGFGEPGGIFPYTYDSGGLNNGIIEYPIIYNTIGTPSENQNASPNILANPYPSAIFADDFLNANSMIGTLYFWEHLTPPSPSIPGAGSMNFDMEDISMYNLSGGMAANNDPGTSTEPNGFVATSQGFGVKASGPGTAVFNNSMRRTSGNNTLRTAEYEERERIWVQVQQTEFELQCTTLLAFNENATSMLDDGYDSRRLATVLSIYSHLEDGSQQLGIQTREAFTDDKEVPIGFATLVEGIQAYKININDLEGEELNAAHVYLIDNFNGNMINLKEQTYEFYSGPGVFHNRFTLVFNREQLGISENSLDSIILLPNPTDSQISIFSPQEVISNVRISDLHGRLINVIKNDSNTLQIDLGTYAASVYFVTIETETGSITRKVIKR